MGKVIKVILNSDDGVVLDQVREALGEHNFELICDPADCSQAPLCRWLDPDALNECGQLTAAIQDAIFTLEQTRHAFRSKQLGGLRRRLENLLQDLPDARS